MKNFSILRKRALVGLLFSVFFINTSIAQKSPEKIGQVNDLKSSLLFTSPVAKIATSKKKTAATKIGKLSVKMNSKKDIAGKLQVIGNVEGSTNSTISLTFEGNNVSGLCVMPETNEAYSYYSDTKGSVYKKTEDIEKVMCTKYSAVPSNAPVVNATINAAPPAGSIAYTLQSLPGAGAVVLLDFDGQFVVNAAWNGGNPINALPYDITESEVIELFKLVSEDFSAFNLNITTDSTVYFNAPANRRIRCICTPTTIAYPGSGGVAYIGSFTWGDDTPCWTFNGGVKGGGETCSHEIGHTLGLWHDGRELPTYHEEYHYGNGNWAPIMGAAFSPDMTQWSIGEYQYANNQQDDIAIITSQNGFTVKTDVCGNTPSTSKPLIMSSSQVINATANSGMIETRSDKDVYSFTLPVGGQVNISIEPSSLYPDLDIVASLLNASGNKIFTNNPVGTACKINRTLGAGTYYLEVDGGGFSSAYLNGYSDYASLGGYKISGTIGGFTNPFPNVVITNPINNSTHNPNSPIDINANAADMNGSVVRVDFYVNDTLYLGSSMAAPFSYTWYPTEVGTYSIKAIATDNEGAIGTSSNVVVNVIYQGDIQGASCVNLYNTFTYAVNPIHRGNATVYSWWANGATQSITVNPATPWEATIQFSQWTPSIDVCVGISYNVSPWYKSFCKRVDQCSNSSAKISAIEESTALVGLSVMPNPSEDLFTVSAKKPVSSIIVANSVGVNVYESKELEKNTAIQFGQDFIPGFYLVSVKYIDGTEEKIKLIKTN